MYSLTKFFNFKVFVRNNMDYSSSLNARFPLFLCHCKCTTLSLLFPCRDIIHTSHDSSFLLHILQYLTSVFMSLLYSIYAISQTQCSVDVVQPKGEKKKMKILLFTVTSSQSSSLSLVFEWKRSLPYLLKVTFTDGTNQQCAVSTFVVLPRDGKLNG